MTTKTQPTVKKKIGALRAGDRTQWYEVLTDVAPLAGAPPLIGCRVRYEDGGEGERAWPADTQAEVEVQP